MREITSDLILGESVNRSDRKLRRVLFIESGQAGGGSFGSLFALISGLDLNLIEPTVLFLNRTGWVDRFEELGIKVLIISDLRYSNDINLKTKRVVNGVVRKADRYLPSLYLFVMRIAHFRTIRRLRKIIRSLRIDMVYLNNQPNRDLFGVIAASGESCRIVSHIRSLRTDNFDTRRAKYVNDTVSLFICASASAKKHWGDRGLSQEKSVIIYNGVNIEELKERRKAKVREDNAGFRLGAVGMLTAVKGHMLLLDVWERVIGMYPNISLEIVGEGIERKVLETAISSRKLKNVHLLGYRSDVVDLVSTFDALVQPSVSENCSRVILEAFALGTPVVASNVGGNPELVIDGYSGLLFERDDEQSLISAIGALVSSEGLREKLSKNAKQLVREKFTADAYVKDIQQQIVQYSY